MTSLFHATQNEIDGDAKNVWSLKVWKHPEGATCQVNIDAINVYKEKWYSYGPAKAANNAGGVAVSALKWAKTANVFHGHVSDDGRLKDIRRTNIFNTAKTTAETSCLGKDYLAGANIAALWKCKTVNADDCTRSCIINRYFSLRPQSFNSWNQYVSGVFL